MAMSMAMSMALAMATSQTQIWSITNPDVDCIKLEIATFKFGDQKTDW